MKKYSIIIAFLALTLSANAQHKINSFFDEKGSVALESTELQEDTVITIFHRRDDVVYRRTIYRIIDLRYKQNFQLYFPTNMSDPYYKSLFGVMLNAICEGLPVYAKPMDISLNPHLENEPLPRNAIAPLLETGNGDGNVGGFDLGAVEGMEGIDMAALGQTPSVLAYDSVNDKMTVTEYYDQFVRNQYKFLIREIIFFDRHYSRLYSSIEAIAPMYAPKSDADNAYDAVYQQVCFWVPFKEFRKYLKNNYIITNSNASKRITFDEFFAKKLYTSYIVGEDNMYDRVVPQYLKTEAGIKKEQARIANDLLNFEQDLWEY